MNHHFEKLLIANRGEIAIRIARAAAEMGIRTVVVYAQDDAAALHVTAGDASVALPGCGAAAYLDMDRMIEVAQLHQCAAIHPGYGFLSERADFARRCREVHIEFVGPDASALELFGDKARARSFAEACGVKAPHGSAGAVTLDQARQFFESLGPHGAMMIKAVAGGGGRGMRVVQSADMLGEAFSRCQSEARTAFGSDAVYVEAYIPNARHIEIQIAGDGEHIIHFGDRECNVQRRHQKLVEVAPSPTISAALRQRLTAAATRMASTSRYRGLCTFEFLVPGDGADEDAYAFIEANPRLQVEHTVTEEVMGVDLVQLQLQIASGRRLADMGWTQDRVGPPRGYAIEARVNMDAGFVSADLDKGVLTVFDLPGGPGVRIDTMAYTGYVPSPNFDSLLAKVIVHHPGPNFTQAVDRARRALNELHIEGVAHNMPLLQSILEHPVFREGGATTEFIDKHLDALTQRTHRPQRKPLFARDATAVTTSASVLEANATDALIAPMRASVLEIPIQIGQAVASGDTVMIVEAMKMEHAITAQRDGIVRAIRVSVGDTIAAGAPLIDFDEAVDRVEMAARDASTPENEDAVRSDLSELFALRALTQDEARPAAVTRRHALGLRTARENIADLCDPGSFVEYGSHAVAAMHTTHTLEDLRRISPADGFIYGLASINGDLFASQRSRCMVASYDYTVFAGTQGHYGHKKHDRMFQLAETAGLPVVLFAEGGGGRPADSDNIGGVNLANPTFWHFGRLSGKVPLVGIAAGRCFAGNAALLGMCDVVIATERATIGMGGPVMIEGAGLGAVEPEQVGPAPMHAKSGVVDILVTDEAQAVAQAKRYLSYFQDSLSRWEAHDSLALRTVIPQRRTRAYDVRRVIALLSDVDSVLELRAQFGRAAVTALVRIEGQPMGIVANNPRENAGAIGAEEAQKITRFLQLCSSFGLPIVSLCDTPGIMVGPDAEKTALVRHATAMFCVGAQLKVPLFTIVLRKAYGLGAMAMAGGSFHLSSQFSIAWPTAEFGAMGLEGQIKLGHRTELEAIEDPAARQARYEELVDNLYERGKAVRIAPFLSIDDVIDPAESRRWVLAGLKAFAVDGQRSA